MYYSLKTVLRSFFYCFILIGFYLVTQGHADCGKPGWIKAKNNSCNVWNPCPGSNEYVTWSGGCKDGYADGVGELQWVVDGKKTERYCGAYKGGKANGLGVYYYQNGNRYEGEFKDDNMHGYGVYYYRSGARYEGRFFENKLTGYGTYHYKPGDACRNYVGHLLNGMQDGIGKQSACKQFNIQGMYKKGKFLKGLDTLEVEEAVKKGESAAQKGIAAAAKSKAVVEKIEKKK